MKQNKEYLGEGVYIKSIGNGVIAISSDHDKIYITAAGVQKLKSWLACIKDEEK